MLSQNNHVSANILQFSSILSPLPVKSILHKLLQDAKCSSYASLAALSIILPRVFFFVSLCPTHQFMFMHCYFRVHAHQRNGCNQHFIIVYDKTWENLVMLSLHDQPALTEGAKVDESKSTLSQHSCRISSAT